MSIWLHLRISSCKNQTKPNKILFCVHWVNENCNHSRNIRAFACACMWCRYFEGFRLRPPCAPCHSPYRIVDQLRPRGRYPPPPPFPPSNSMPNKLAIIESKKPAHTIHRTRSNKSEQFCILFVDAERGWWCKGGGQLTPIFEKLFCWSRFSKVTVILARNLRENFGVLKKHSRNP